MDNALTAERKQLNQTWSDLDDGSFPGSPRARKAKAAREALEAFDAAHPEVLTEMNKASRSAADARLAGVDIGGL